MATRMQQRRGTAAQWTSANPILNAGEIGYETDTNQFKIGDGTNHWADLSYFIDETALSTSLGDYVETSLLGVANGVATLNSLGKIESSQIPNIDELAQDAVDSALVAGTGLTKLYSDNANTITLAIDGNVITGSDPQQLLNKTIVLANNTVSGTLADFNLAMTDADFATLAGAETLTNKTISSANNTVSLVANTISDFAEAAVDAAANALTSGSHTNISVSYNDENGTISITAAPGYSNEDAQDAVGGSVGNGLTYNDTSGSIYVDTTVIQARIANVSDTEIGYLQNVTSDIQTQLDAKAETSALSNHESDTTNIHGIANTAVLVTLNGSETLNNKSINLANNTITGTVAQFNSALSDDNFATLTGTETLTNKTLSNPTVTVAISSQSTIVEPQADTVIAFDNYGANYLTINNGNGAFGNGSLSTNGLVGKQIVVSGGPSGNGTYTIATIESQDSNSLYTTVVESVPSNYQYDYYTVSIIGTTSSNATISSTEISYLDGITSNVQAQLDAKAPLASPTFTGNAVFTGNIEIDQNLTVDGNFIVNGSNVLVSATQIQIEDSLLQLAHENANNTVDLGLVVAYNDGTAKHAGIVRDVSASTWKLFKDVTDEPSTTVNFTQGSLDDLQVAGLTATSLTMGNVTATEFGYLDGVTSAIQTQIDGKISASSTNTLTNKTLNLANNTVSGTIAQFNTALSDADFATLAGTETLSGKTLSSAILSGTLTANNSVGASGQYLESTGTGVRWTSVSGYSAPTLGSTSIASGATVSTVDALTLTNSRVQLAMNAQTGTAYTLVVGDASNKWVTCSNTGAITVTVPPSVFSVGDTISIQQINTGQVTFAAGSGVTITSAGASTAAPKIRTRYSSATVICVASNNFTIIGDIV
jgi:hypothetical protein